MVRATHGIRSGNWYFEVQILDPPSVGEVVRSLPGHVRLGEKLREGLRMGMLREKKEEGNGAVLQDRIADCGYLHEAPQRHPVCCSEKNDHGMVVLVVTYVVLRQLLQLARE